MKKSPVDSVSRVLFGRDDHWPLLDEAEDAAMERFIAGCVVLSTVSGFALGLLFGAAL